MADPSKYTRRRREQLAEERRESIRRGADPLGYLTASAGRLVIPVAPG